MERDYCEAFQQRGRKETVVEGIKARDALKKEDDVTDGEEKNDGGLARKGACVCIMCIM